MKIDCVKFEYTSLFCLVVIVIILFICIFYMSFICNYIFLLSHGIFFFHFDKLILKFYFLILNCVGELCGQIFGISPLRITIIALIPLILLSWIRSFQELTIFTTINEIKE